MQGENTDLSKGKIVIYTGRDGINSIEIVQQDDSLWLSVEQIADVFGKDRSNIQRHIKHIFDEEELDKESTCAFFAQVQKEGVREVKRRIPYYIIWTLFWRSGIGCLPKSPLNSVNGLQMFYINTLLTVTL